VTATVSDAANASVNVSVYNAANTLTHGPVVLASGQTSGDIPLNVGANRIEVILLAEGGSGTTYHVTVTREAAPSTSTGGGGGGVNTVNLQKRQDQRSSRKCRRSEFWMAILKLPFQPTLPASNWS